MNIFEQIEKIDEQIEARRTKEAESLQVASGASSSGGMGFAGSTPWSQNSPTAMRTDMDKDGVPDAVDNFYGPGVNSYGDSNQF